MNGILNNCVVGLCILWFRWFRWKQVDDGIKIPSQSSLPKLCAKHPTLETSLVGCQRHWASSRHMVGAWQRCTSSPLLVPLLNRKPVHQNSRARVYFQKVCGYIGKRAENSSKYILACLIYL